MPTEWLMTNAVVELFGATMLVADPMCINYIMWILYVPTLLIAFISLICAWRPLWVRTAVIVAEARMAMASITLVILMPMVVGVHCYVVTDVDKREVAVAKCLIVNWTCEIVFVWALYLLMFQTIRLIVSRK